MTHALAGCSLTCTTVDKWVSIFGLAIYVVTLACYFKAVFTDPGSPLVTNTASGYSSLPTTESKSAPSPSYTSLAAKSNGQPRFCKKCQCVKPDRAHHCSTCGRCVMKMDHHCPWLATCVGFHNYKAFVLFIGYTSIFAWTCFFKSATFVWAVMADDNMDRVPDARSIINAIILTVIGGVIGLTLMMFTGFHLSLIYSGETTIESLEKTRYLGPIKRNMEAQLRKEKQQVMSGIEHAASPLEQLKTIHANALPGVTRPEEGIEDDDDAGPYEDKPGYRQQSPEEARRSYAERELRREQERYENYLDERDSERLPHAFDLGWKRNFADVFGSNPLIWFLPILNSPGDGWRWDVSPRWSEECDQLIRERNTRRQQMQQYSPAAQHNPHHLASPLLVPSGPPQYQARSWSRGREPYAQNVGRRNAHQSALTPSDCEPPYHDQCAEHGGSSPPRHHYSPELDVPELIEREATPTPRVTPPRPRSESVDPRTKGD